MTSRVFPFKSIFSEGKATCVLFLFYFLYSIIIYFHSRFCHYTHFEEIAESKVHEKKTTTNEEPQEQHNAILFKGFENGFV